MEYKEEEEAEEEEDEEEEENPGAPKNGTHFVHDPKKPPLSDSIRSADPRPSSSD